MNLTVNVGIQFVSSANEVTLPLVCFGLSVAVCEKREKKNRNVCHSQDLRR